MATNHRGNCCSNKLCSMLSAILSTISFINGMWCHGSDYTPVKSDPNMCLHVRGGNKSISFKHATCSVWGNKQLALSVPYNKHCGCECMGGGQGTKPHCSIGCVYRTLTRTSSASNKKLFNIYLKLFVFFHVWCNICPSYNHWWCSRCFVSSAKKLLAAEYKHDC